LSGRVELRGAAALATTLLLWATAFVAIRAGLEAYAPAHLVLLRFLVASVTLAAYAVWAARRGTGLPRIERGALRGVVLVGFWGFAVYQIALSYGEQRVPAGPASLIVSAVPLLTTLVAVATLGERLRGVGWLGMGIGFAGVATVALAGGDEIRFEPRMLAIGLAAIAQALHFVIQKSYLRSTPPLVFTTYAVWVGTALLLPFARDLPAVVGDAPADATLAVVFLGVFPAALANVTWAYVLARISVARAASFLYLVPALTFLIAWRWRGETPAVAAILGGCLALAGVVMVNVHGVRRRASGTRWSPEPHKQPVIPRLRSG
jgi:drug/metabolite transporter (DMT)-like permease